MDKLFDGSRTLVTRTKRRVTTDLPIRSPDVEPVEETCAPAASRTYEILRTGQGVIVRCGDRSHDFWVTNPQWTDGWGIDEDDDSLVHTDEAGTVLHRFSLSAVFPYRREVITGVDPATGEVAQLVSLIGVRTEDAPGISIAVDSVGVIPHETQPGAFRYNMDGTLELFDGDATAAVISNLTTSYDVMASSIEVLRGVDEQTYAEGMRRIQEQFETLTTSLVEQYRMTQRSLSALREQYDVLRQISLPWYVTLFATIEEWFDKLVRSVTFWK